MAGKKKKDKNVEVAQEERNGSKLLTILIVIAIVLIWLGIFGVLIKMDVGNFGSEVLAPVIKDVPVINRILPKSEEDTQTLAYTNIDEANAKIKQLENELASLKSTNSASEDEVSQLKKEVERLKKFEEQQKSFEQRVKTFDENVVYNDQAPDISEYKKYYEEIDPDNAASIYKDVSKDLIYSDKITKQATMYGKMDPEKAAAVLETMTGDLDLVASILDSMSESKSSAILAEMTPETAAQITTKMTAK
ncbi:MAG: hypothetical protein PUG66_04250 [Clostridiales bacterium]|nr:hypothetical protein [Clostridiales bacterium]